MTDDQQTDDIDIPAGFVPEAEVSTLRQELSKTKRLLQKATTNRPDPSALLDDPDHVRSVFEKHGVPYDEEGRFKLPETMKDAAAMEEAYKARLMRTQEEWRKKELAPVAEKLSKYEEQLNNTRKTSLRQALEQGARNAGVVDGKFKPLPFGKAKNYAPVHAAESLFSWDDEHGDWVMRDGDDLVYDTAGNPITAGTSYWNYLRETADQDTQTEWFGDNRQRGSNFQNKGTGRGAFTMKRADVRANPRGLVELKKRAAAAGQSVRIID